LVIYLYDTILYVNTVDGHCTEMDLGGSGSGLSDLVDENLQRDLKNPRKGLVQYGKNKI